MRIGSVCSGIGAPEVAWRPLGFEPQWCSEIEAFPSEVLERHHGHPNLGDMTKLTEQKEFHARPIDLLVGGTPCQSFSVAGLRAGLADPRGNLALVYLQILDRARPRWMVWENVPGVLSSWSDAETDQGGRGTWQTNDFDTFLCGLSQLGYGWAWRVLDAQYVRVESHARAVPQRRRRVFVVGYLGDWRRAAAVLFERESLRGHSPPSRKAGQGIAGTISSRTEGGGGLGTDFELDGGLVSVAHTLLREGSDASPDGVGGGYNVIPVVSPALKARDSKGPSSDGDGDGDGDGACLVPIPFDTTQITHRENRSNPQPGDPSPSLSKASHPPAIAFSARQDPDAAINVSPAIGTKDEGMGVAFDTYNQASDLVSHTLHAGPGSGLDDSAPATLHGMRVRRLTPRECERLQGFPDDYTLIARRGRPAADGPRYKALGNSMAVNVMRWIGERIVQVEALNG